MYCPFIAEEPSQNGEGCSFRVRGQKLSQIPCVLRGFSLVGCTSTPRVHRYSVTPVACGRVCPLPEDKELPLAVPGRHFREHHLLLRGAHGKVNRPVWHPTNVAKTAFEQVECGFMFGPRAPSGPETHNNVKDKTETGRDSVGL